MPWGAKPEDTTNHRNGTRGKTVLTDDGPLASKAVYLALAVLPDGARLKPQASSPTPQASSLKPQASSLKPTPRASRPREFADNLAVLLSAASISKTFAGVRALKGVTFELRAGEVHALVGENGAGKSTLIKIVAGAETPDAGTLTVGGNVVRHMTPATAKALGIAVIYQQPALFPDLTVSENIALSLEPPALWRRVDWRDRDRGARELLLRVGAAIDPQRLAATLTMPEQQLVEIAKAIGADARIVFMDEPSASLTEREVERLFGVIARLRAAGVGIVYISHRLEEVFRIADRVTVLRDGETVATRAREAVDRAELIQLMVGRELAAVFPKRSIPLGDVVFEVRGLGNRAAGLHDISLSVRRGEILGIAGLVGSGRTELAESIFGLRALDAGELLLSGTPIHIASPADAIAAGIGYVPEDRRRHGVVLDMPITANTSVANLGAIARRGLIDRAVERTAAEGYVNRLRIRAASVYQEAGTLSGGNQQKVAVARWLATNPAVLILDEPTQGVDIGAKSEMHALMQDLVERGLAIIMISSELPEILGMSDRVVVMRKGRIAGELTRADATQHAILALALEDAA
jgi:rhamnose transport system ATP-binding protein